ncbi:MULTISPECIES: SRPBCC family protein [Methylocaldum]|jgi:carbon monoxide dehydrogenase subunit G|uniref:SRPBCC family protein n=1 Tax=unclassified Methylocaldum TaxID=2622260 RepID=UPI00098AAE0F|nr:MULTISPECIES: SRPBCC family protein [unclassified Methylocaldum]MBP1150245.1 carbon monoxide dehydrogenase subunit G [Methylocaldum sp. RMAD-M]MDV3241208.1 SRPBCC family protein [Methylocaldum sp.]MVF23380.1 SRPBCC family protein [Methylocaldum sp. BRCS4]
MTTFFFIVLLFAVLILAATFVGRKLPKTHVAASRIRLSAPPNKVWDIINDFESYATWRPGLHRTERGPDIDGLPSWYEICSQHSRVHFRVVERKLPSRLVTKIVGDDLPLSGTWIYELEEDGDGTVLTITEQENIHNPLLRFFDRFVICYYGVMDVYLIALAIKLGDSARPQHLSLKIDDSSMTA